MQLNRVILQMNREYLPGGRACLYIQASPPLGHVQNQPYLQFSTASRKNLQIWKTKTKHWRYN